MFFVNLYRESYVEIHRSFGGMVKTFVLQNEGLALKVARYGKRMTVTIFWQIQNTNSVISRCCSILMNAKYLWHHDQNKIPFGI